MSELAGAIRWYEKAEPWHNEHSDRMADAARKVSEGSFTRREKLELLGWEKCPTCKGLGNFEHVDGKACPNCLDGLVPPASQVEAGSDALLGEGTAWMDGVRAALIAAMRKGVGDE